LKSVAKEVECAAALAAADADVGSPPAHFTPPAPSPLDPGVVARAAHAVTKLQAMWRGKQLRDDLYWELMGYDGGGEGEEGDEAEDLDGEARPQKVVTSESSELQEQENGKVKWAL
jgi:hypothetical protein